MAPNPLFRLFDTRPDRRLVSSGDAARDRRDWAEAAALYARALRAAPGREPIWVQLGHMRKEAGDLSGAERAYGRALQLAPDNADTWINVGHLLKLQRRDADAARAYARADGLAPGRTDLTDERARLARLGFPGDGPPPGLAVEETAAPPPRSPAPAGRRRRPLWRRALASLTGDPRGRAAAPFVREGDAARDRSDWPAAAAAYRRAVDIHPDRAAIWVQLGHMSKEGGEYDAAEAAYREALRREPENGDTHLNLGHLMKMRGRPGEALAAYRRAVELEPERTDWRREVVAAVRLLDAAQGSPELEADPLVRLLREVAGGAAARTMAALPPAQAARAADALAGAPSAGAAPGTTAGSPSLLAPPAAAAEIVFDISDLMSFFTHSRLPTGIQRVQIEAVSAVLRSPPPGLRVGVCAFSEARSAWSAAPEAVFLDVCRLALSGDDASALEWRIAVGRLEVAFEAAGPLAFARGAVLVNLGASWEQGNYYLALRGAKVRHGVRYVPFVHDLIPVVAPDFHVEALTRDFIGWLRSLLAHADGVLANSAHTLQDLRRAAAQLGLPLPGDREEVVHLDARMNADPQGPLDPEVLRKYGVDPGGFVLFVSTVEPRKGHFTAFGAWAQLVRDHGPRAPKLVCVGRLGWMHDAAIARLRASSALRDRVQIASGVSDHELDTLYKACAFTLYASSYEGWGLPITESLTYGKVPLTSDHPSLREAGGDFAELFETGSERSLAAAVERLHLEAGLRARGEQRIRDGFHARTWAEVGAQIVQTAARWRDGGDPPRGVDPPALSLGRLYGLGRNTSAELDRDAVTGEALRRGDGWWGPETWGCWTKPQPALLSFAAPAGTGPLRVYLGLRGPPGQPCRYRVALGGETLAEGRLEPGQVSWVCRTAPARAGEVSLTVAGDAAWPLEGRPEPRQGGLGVIGLMMCEEGDLLARSAFVEEHLSERMALIA